MFCRKSFLCFITCSVIIVFLSFLYNDAHSEVVIIDNNDGTITAPQTGLMWEKYPSANDMSYQQAEIYIEELNWTEYAGYTDWKLPTSSQLLEVADYLSTLPTFSGNEDYWSKYNGQLGGPGGLYIIDHGGGNIETGFAFLMPAKVFSVRNLDSDNQYTVTFLDHDGTELRTETVDHGSSAAAPEDPTREGYTFTGWDRAFENVTGDITVTATYTANFEDGDGTADNPYLLAHSAQLGQIRGHLASYFELEGDIDLEDVGDWQPIGTVTDPFTGGFDGAGHVISNLVIDDSNADNAGLFGYTDGAMITKTGLENVDINAGNYIGALVGYARNTTILETYATGFVSGNDDVGGLVGTLSTDSESLVSDSYANCNVSGNDAVGGLVGNLGSSAYITNAYAVGSVDNGSNPGGLVGANEDGTQGNVTDSFWDIDFGPDTSQGGTGKTTAEMMQQTTFIGWDFNDTWAISEGDSYPYLQWQPAPDIDDDEEPEDTDEDKSSGSSSGCFVDTLKSGK